MKCDELKVYEEMEDYVGYENDTPTEMYDKSEVDAAIAELKAEITRKEGVEKRWFAQCMEARAENVMLKRALWMARAERAKERQNYESGCRSDGWVHRENMWLEVERLCRHKAEEYK